MRRSLTLKRETLTELPTTALANVAGAAERPTDPCSVQECPTLPLGPCLSFPHCTA
jgi:hypothetical protein